MNAFEVRKGRMCRIKEGSPMSAGNASPSRLVGGHCILGKGHILVPKNGPGCV